MDCGKYRELLICSVREIAIEHLFQSLRARLFVIREFLIMVLVIAMIFLFLIILVIL